MTILTKAAEDVIAERNRQIEKEGYRPEHDDEHDKGELALAAIALAAPRQVFVREDLAVGIQFNDPWPWENGDKRIQCGERKANPGNMPPNPDTYTAEERRDLLVKAAALLLAEIERVDRAAETPIVA